MQPSGTTAIEGQESECFVVGQLRSAFFFQQLAVFVREVQRVKALANDANLAGVAPSLLLEPVMDF